MMARLKSAAGSPRSRGIGEGAFVASLTELCVDGVIQGAPWFTTHRVELVVVLGALLGALVHHTFARFIWRSPRG